nr:phospholipase-like protein [Tanacetum cinerariifolium]
MMKVLETLSSVRFMELMSECLELDGLIVRLFKQFLTASESNSSAISPLVCSQLGGKVLKNYVARLSKPHLFDM